jgi:DNA-binding transcriptional ArsR family regulator
MNDFASIASLIGDPTRGRIVDALMDGRARTATELALDGGVAPSTASSHLAQLSSAGILAVVKQGRHRYFRIADFKVAQVIEGLMRISADDGKSSQRFGPSDETLRRARVCYDHIAGEAGVSLFDQLRKGGILSDNDDSPVLTPVGENWCKRIGMDVAAIRKQRRPLCLACLDWSERRIHLAGALGAALLERMLVLRYARRMPDSRVLLFSPQGKAFIEHPWG